MLTLVAVGLAVAGWFLPRPDSKPVASSAPAYSEQEVADAKEAVCDAYQKARDSVVLNSSRETGGDRTIELIVGLDSRQAFIAAGNYLLTKLSEQPATPPDLAAAVRKLGTVYQELAIDFLNEVSETARQSTVDSGNEAGSIIRGLCK